MVRGDSIEGLHTFNLKKNISWDSSEKSVDSRNQKSAKDKSFSKALYVEEKVKVNDTALNKSYGNLIFLFYRAN